MQSPVRKYMIVIVQLLSCVWLFVTPWTAAHQTSLSFSISWSLLTLMSIELMMPSNHLILCCPFSLLPFPLSGSSPMSWLITSGGQSIGASVSAPVLPMNIQGWLLLGLTNLISLPPKGLKSLLQHHSSKASILQCPVKISSLGYYHHKIQQKNVLQKEKMVPI